MFDGTLFKPLQVFALSRWVPVYHPKHTHIITSEVWRSLLGLSWKKWLSPWSSPMTYICQVFSQAVKLCCSCSWKDSQNEIPWLNHSQPPGLVIVIQPGAVSQFTFLFFSWEYRCESHCIKKHSHLNANPKILLKFTHSIFNSFV